MKYLALDPGGTTGYAVFNETGDLEGIGEVFNRDELRDLLNDTKPTLVICEDWKTNPNISFGNNRMETVRIIGQIEEWCSTHNTIIVLQPNTIKSIGYRWAGKSKSKNKALSHRLDAYVHGVYYLQKNGIRRPQQGAAKANG